jgi:glycosyltransferase involved in cell wall biosynthesis
MERAEAEVPAISVILPVGDRSREAALLAVIGSFLNQVEVAFELIVVEQGVAPRSAGAFPAGVRCLHVESLAASEFNKSRAMNEGVRRSRSPWVLLHDADVVVPERYLAAILERAGTGEWDAIRPIRFLFYPGEAASAAWIETGRLPAAVERVTQNFPGGSTAVRRDIYWELGGHDERFVGWGGEDTEFLDRLRTRRVYPGGYAPALHLWHAPADKKRTGDRNQKLQDERLSVPVEDRIRELRALWGQGATGARA